MATEVNSLASATQDQFLQLLIAQVQNQDPFNPVSDTEFVAQLAQFSSLQSLQTLNANFSQLLQLQQISQGSDLIGKSVEYFLDSNASQTRTGTVDRVNVVDGQIQLQIGTDLIGLDNLKGVIG